MVREQIMPMEEDYHAEIGREGDRFKPTARQTEIMETLKNRARSRRACGTSG
jgi:acyl-CoA dehydrogenase